MELAVVLLEIFLWAMADIFEVASLDRIIFWLFNF